MRRFFILTNNFLKICNMNVLLDHLTLCLLCVSCVLGSLITFLDDARLVQGTNANVDQALQFLREFNLEASEICFRVNSAQWNYATNITETNRRKMIEEQIVKAKFDKLSWKKAINFDWTRLNDIMARKQIRMLTTNTRASLPDEKYNEIYLLISEMKDLYSHVRACPFVPNGSNDLSYCDMNLSDVQATMANSRNSAELLHIWKEWHDKTGPILKNSFLRYVELANESARINGFSDAGEEMRYIYEDRDFEDELAETLQKIQPLYKQLLTYVRRKLVNKYGPEIVREDGPLPAHILGDLWGQDWSKLADFVLPYPEYGRIDIAREMLRHGFTPLRMFQLAEEFYTSLGLKPMPPEFWRYSMIEKPSGRKVQCTASAWDFCNKIDYRIKQCTEVDMKNLLTVHHEMAHIEYYLYYADLPYLYRDGANPGFHEGVANAITLSVNNPTHLKNIGLFHNSTDIYESNINFLMMMALQKVAYAPFAYLIDQWRYGVFETGVKRLNSNWWDLRLRYQGVIPPVPRTEFHFDAAAKRHIPADIPYVRYYVSLILEFQIFDALCFAAGHKGPLHKCDIYRSREAGRVLSEILKSGKGTHWRDVIKLMTRGETDRLSADAMLDYFEPLFIWLKVQNKDEKIIGWTTFKEDTALFQPLVYARSSTNYSSRTLLIFVIIFNSLWKIYNL